MFKNVAKLGINLAELGNKGLLVHIKLLIAVAKKALDTAFKLMTKDLYRVAVIGFINLITGFLRKRAKSGVTSDL